jgi:hypothetical protein
METEFSTLKDLLLMEEVNPASYANDDKYLLYYLQKKLVGKKIWMSNSPNWIIVKKVLHASLDENNYIIIPEQMPDAYKERHPVGNPFAIQQLKPLLPKRSKIEWETPSRQNPTNFTFTMFIPPDFKNDYVDGILVKEQADLLPLLITSKAKPDLQRACEIVNNHIINNTYDLLDCQEELINNKLHKFAKIIN